MSRSPYQPSLLRLLHTSTSLLVVALWLTGLVVHGLHDGRVFQLPAGFGGVDWIDLHGSFGVPLVLLTTLFVPYSLSLGRALLRRPSNLLPLLALLLAVGSGLLMREEEVRVGQTANLIYAAHLTAWGLMTLAVLLHLANNLRRGGWPLALSMFRTQMRSGDRPADWPAQLRRHFRRG
jgi:hypothetical protein